MHRFFVEPGIVLEGDVTLSGETARQIHTVLRMRSGMPIMLLDNSGWEYPSELVEVQARQVIARVTGRQQNARALSCRITLYQSLLKKDNFEWVLQKATEIGAAGFVPVISQRCVVNDVSAQKRVRWGQIVREAAEQSGRGTIPHIHEAMHLSAALGHTVGMRLMAWEEAQDGALDVGSVSSGAVAVFIGPEGGYDAAEIRLAEAHGAQIITLGKRILRAETAAIYAMSVLAFLSDTSSTTTMDGHDG